MREKNVSKASAATHILSVGFHMGRRDKSGARLGARKESGLHTCYATSLYYATSNVQIGLSKGATLHAIRVHTAQSVMSHPCSLSLYCLQICTEPVHIIKSDAVWENRKAFRKKIGLQKNPAFIMLTFTHMLAICQYSGSYTTYNSLKKFHDYFQCCKSVSLVL